MPIFQRENGSVILDTWKQVANLFFKHRVLFVPFLFVAVLEFVFLFILALAPQHPFSSILAPPIRVLWGERFLHYPYQFLLLPSLFNYARMFITVVIGIVMTGAVICMIGQIMNRQTPHLKNSIRRALGCYVKLFTVWVMTVAAIGATFRFTQYIFIWTGQFYHLNTIMINLALLTCFMISMAVQSLLVYCMPVVMIENRNLVDSFKRSFLFGKRLFFVTFVLTIVPTLPYLLYGTLSEHLPQLMQRFFPEIVLVILGIGILLHLAVDVLVTASTTILFIQKRSDV